MRLQWVELDQFRNLGSQKIDLHPRFNLLLGQNGQGKTNFLEAIGYLGSLRSFRSAGRSEMIRYDQSLCRVSGSVLSEGHEKKIAFAMTRKERTQFLEDRKINSPEEYLQALKVVHFIPEDVGLVSGPPAWRRKVMDRSVFEVTPQYVNEYRKYLMVLRQRNALLRRGRVSVEELGSWNEALALSGAVLIARRLKLIGELNPVMGELGRQLGLGTGLGLTYLPAHRAYGAAVKLEPAAQIDAEKGRKTTSDNRSLAAGILESLKEVAETEFKTGYTRTGPHRDNIIFVLEKKGAGHDLARYGSQGQKRSAVLAFKLAVAFTFQRTMGAWPIILLDDVASELDETRRKALGNIIRQTQAQFFISTTGEEYMFLPGNEGKVFQVTGGQLKPFNNGPQLHGGANCC